MGVFTKTKKAPKSAHPVCSKCGSDLKIDWAYQEIECPKCGEFQD
jgi:DNA-directed RNA polymerase subunit RPC12/RpoP